MSLLDTTTKFTFLLFANALSAKKSNNFFVTIVGRATTIIKEQYRKGAMNHCTKPIHKTKKRD